jgi:hypothetical protein
VIRGAGTTRSVAIGIYADAEPPRLRATPPSPGLRPSASAALALLADGPDDVTGAALATLDMRWSPTRSSAGPLECFNRLAASTDADVVILLESGSIPAPGALERLVAAVLQDGVGLAGPSTNDAWNEQRVFRHRQGDTADVVRAGAEVSRRYGEETRSLAPLYGVAEFCFAVRREVIEAIGGADEAYGLGPCWEMEYCARAARAGFDVRWLCGAYVYRAPCTDRRREQEARLFEASRRHYQDGLCALKLRGESDGYEPHCRGEGCEHFAPPELSALRRRFRRSRRSRSRTCQTLSAAVTFEDEGCSIEDLRVPKPGDFSST